MRGRMGLMGMDMRRSITALVEVAVVLLFVWTTCLEHRGRPYELFDRLDNWGADLEVWQTMDSQR